MDESKISQFSFHNYDKGQKPYSCFYLTKNTAAIVSANFAGSILYCDKLSIEKKKIPLFVVLLLHVFVIYDI
ncbi:hypothetical protein VIGAN_06198300 [Vigna angularis var. angularis]|uniref:Uncharacterized protein n=1 Tax=Vigna angularis var. angularis TaxID=157739 RepID=A0A0S3SCW0_PHAAN|nr:hypothetical protein VIGAN_06198300 [Vigna angularis var. angularis]